MVNISYEIAKHRDLEHWRPQIGDFIIYHGWLWRRWYGLISELDTKTGGFTVIMEGLPVLLLRLKSHEFGKNTKFFKPDDIISCGPGEYAVLQDGVWYVK